MSRKKEQEAPSTDLNGLLSELNIKLDDVQAGKSSSLSFCYDSRIGEALYRRSRILSLSRNSSSSQLAPLSPAPSPPPTPPLNAYQNSVPLNESTVSSPIPSDGVSTVSSALPPLPNHVKAVQSQSSEINAPVSPLTTRISHDIIPGTPPRTPPLRSSSGGSSSGGFGTSSIGIVSAALDRMFRLDTLVQLTISNCAVVELPHEIGLLGNLKQLGLNSNKLSKLPGSLRNLQQLEVFSAPHNHFDCIPAEILALPK